MNETTLEALSTAQVLALWERQAGRLDPVTRRRILAEARRHGWDRTWDDGERARAA